MGHKAVTCKSKGKVRSEKGVRVVNVRGEESLWEFQGGKK